MSYHSIAVPIALAATTVRIEAAWSSVCIMGREFIFTSPTIWRKRSYDARRISRLWRALSEANRERSSSNLILHHGAAGVKSKGAEGVIARTSQGSAADCRLSAQAKQRVRVRFLKRPLGHRRPFSLRQTAGLRSGRQWPECADSGHKFCRALLE